MNKSQRMRKDLIAFVQDRYEDITDIDTLMDYMSTEEGYADYMRLAILDDDIEDTLVEIGKQEQVQAAKEQREGTKGKSGRGHAIDWAKKIATYIGQNAKEETRKPEYFLLKELYAIESDLKQLFTDEDIKSKGIRALSEKVLEKIDQRFALDEKKRVVARKLAQEAIEYYETGKKSKGGKQGSGGECPGHTVEPQKGKKGDTRKGPDKTDK